MHRISDKLDPLRWREGMAPPLFGVGQFGDFEMQMSLWVSEGGANIDAVINGGNVLGLRLIGSNGVYRAGLGTGREMGPDPARFHETGWDA